MSTRPTRAKRATVPLPEVDDFVEAPKPKTPRGRKRKADDDEPPVDEIEDMLTNPKSRLASVDLNRIINATTWACLSPDARAILCTTLPAAAFPGFQPQLGARHPARRPQQEQSNSSDVRMDDDAPIGNVVELDPAFLSSPFVTAALTTFQDNLSCGYFSRAHLKELAEYENGVREGTLHAAWKDDAWDERLKEDDAPARETRPAKPPPKKIVPRLIDLINDDVVRVGDVLSYDRQFDSGVRIRKDVLVHAIHPRTHALTALFASSTSERLPEALLPVSIPPDLSSVAHTAVSVTTPAQLETAILSADGRAGRVPRLSAAEASEVAWKSFVLWRVGAGVGESASGSGSGSGENLHLDSEGPGGRAPAGMLVALRDAWAAGQQE